MTQELTIYGEKKGGGHTPVEANDTLDSKQTVRLLFALSEGEIQGIDDILVNGASISNYSSTVSYEVRTGTIDQTVIGGFSDVEAPIQGAGSFPVSLLSGVQHTYSLSATYDAARLTLTLPRLEQVTSQGDRVGYSVSMSIYRRTHVYGSAPGSWQLATSITKDGKCTNPYSFDVRVAKPTGLASVDSWEIMVVRDSADDTSDHYMSTSVLSNITTIVEKTLTYPKTALIGVTLKDASVFSGGIPEIKFKVKGIKVPLPTNYNAATHVYTETTPWDGSFKTYNEYTNNLGWVTYWILRNSDWGLGISAADVDLGSFYSYAKYCDGLVSNGLGGTEFRYTINVQFINRDNVPTFLTYLLNLGNANFATNSLGQISIIYDHAGQAITKVVSNANVIDGMFEYTSNDLESRTNLVNVTYARDSLFGDSDTATAYEQTLINRYGLQTSDVILFGCTSEAQAVRKARWALYTNCKTTDLVTFKQLFYGASYTIGELISVMDSDNVIAKAKHAIITGSSITSGTTTITLDRAIHLDNYSYTVQFVSSDGLTIVSKTIPQINGDFSSISYTGAEVPYTGATILFSSTALQPRTFKVTKIDKDTDGVYTITGLIHDENKYTYIEGIGSLPLPSASGNFVNYSDFSIPAVTNITIQQVYASNGVIDLNKINIKWDWADAGANYRPNFIVSYRRDNQTAVIVNDLTTTSFDIEYPLPGVYDIFVWASNPFSGIKSAVTEYVYNYRVASATSSLNPPTAVVVSGTNGVEFSGKDCVLTWANNTANDTSVDKLNDYVVQVLTSAAVLKGTFTIPYDTNKGGTFNLTYDMNVGLFGAATRSFKVRVFSRDLIGDLSNYIEVSPSNTAPIISSFSVSNVFKAAYLKATIPTDPDVINYTFKKYDAATGGTLLGSINSVSNYIDFEATAGTTYYYTATANDVYGAGTETTRTAGTAISIDPDTYTYTGLTFKPNSTDGSTITTNAVYWSSFVATKNGTTATTVAAGTATWSSGILYLYYIPGNATLQSNTSLTTAIAAGGRVLATYKGGTALTADEGRAFTSGDMILAGTVGSNALVTNTAVITNMAQIGNVLQSDNYSNSGTYTGWRLDKTGALNANSITIKDSSGNLIFATGSGLNWNTAGVYGSNKPADGATRNVFKGNWTTATAYSLGDIVIDAYGYGWSCISAHTSSASLLTPVYPITSNTYWTLYTVKGADGANAQYVIVTGDQTFKFIAGSATPVSTSIVLTATLYGGLSVYDWEYWNGTAWVNLSGTQTANTYTLTYNATEWGSATSLRIRCNSTGYTDEITIVKLYDGANGINAVSGYLTNEVHTEAALNDGTGYSLANAGGTFKVYNGITDVTSTSAFAVTGGTTVSTSSSKTQNGLTFTINIATGIYTLSGASWTTDTEIFTVTATYGTTVLTKVYSIDKSKKGADGAGGISAILTNETHTFPSLSDGTVSSYTGSGTGIYVYEGSGQLSYDGIGTSNGTWKLTTTATNITVGTITDAGIYASVGVQSGVAAGIDTSSIVYTITGKSLAGVSFSFSKTQTFSKSKAGATGAVGGTITLTANRVATFTATDGTLDSGQSDIVLTANLLNITGATYTWSFSGFQTAPIASGLATQTITSVQFGTSKGAKVTCTVTAGGSTYVDDMSIVRLEKSTAAAGATVGATWGSNISGQPSNDLILNNLQTGTWIPGQNPIWQYIGGIGSNSIVFDTDVNNIKIPVWKCISDGVFTSGDNPEGGWDPNYNNPSLGNNWFKVDKNKTYRFAVPIKITNGNTGRYYWGIAGNTVCDLNTINKNINPYFVYGNRNDLVANRWYLLVGYVFPAGSTDNTNAGSGIFDLVTGELVADRLNYCWANDVEYTGTRAYQYYCNNVGETQVFGYPIVEVVDGTESKLFNNLGYAALLNAQQKWSDVSGTGKPADNATVGATIGVNLSGQITTANASTYIANAAIGAAQIGSLSLTGNNFNVKSATTGARMEMDNNVIKVYDASNVLRVKLGNLSA